MQLARYQMAVMEDKLNNLTRLHERAQADFWNVGNIWIVQKIQQYFNW